MFSKEDRFILKKNQLAEVICQFRFPEILIIGANPPAQFQELIRDAYPQYQVRKEASAPKVTGSPGHLHLEDQTITTNYQFSSSDGNWRINLTSGFISLSCSRYTCWEEFASKLDKPLAAFIRTYHPAYFTRIGLRYLNFISRKDLGLEHTPFSELIEPAYLGILAEEDVTEHTVNSCTVDAQMRLRSGCTLKVHAGPGMVKQKGVADQEVRFIFDQDIFMTGDIPVSASASSLTTLHSHAYPTFRGAIQDLLFSAMEPESI